MAFSLNVNLIAKLDQSSINTIRNQLAGIKIGGVGGGAAGGGVGRPGGGASIRTDLGGSARKAAKDTAALNAELRKTKTAAAGAASAANKAGGAISKFGSQAFLAGKRYLSFVAATAVPIAAIRGLKGAFSAVIAFDKSLIGLSQILDTTVEQVGGLGDFMLELSVNTGTSQEEIAGITKTLAQAGLRGKELTDTLTTLSKVPLVATFSSIDSATEGVIATMNQFREEGLSAEDVLDRLSNVSRSFAIDSDDLAEGIIRAGGAFSAVGGNFNELLAVLTTIRSVTRESAATVGVAVKTITTRLARVRTVDFLESIGVQVRDAEGDILSFIDVIRNLEGAFAAANKQQKAQIAEALGGFRQISRVFAVLRAPDILEEALLKADNAQGVFSEQAQKGLASLESQIGRLVGEFNKLIQSLREPVFAPLIEAALIFGQALNTVLTFVSPLLPALIGIGTAAVAISATTLAITKLGAAIAAVNALRLAGLAGLGRIGLPIAGAAIAGGGGTTNEIETRRARNAGRTDFPGARAANTQIIGLGGAAKSARASINALGKSQLGQAAIVGVISIGLQSLAGALREAGQETAAFGLEVVAGIAQFAILASFLTGFRLNELAGAAKGLFTLQAAAAGASTTLAVLASPITLAAAVVALPIVGAAKAQADIEGIFDQVSEQIGKIKVEETVESVENAIAKLGFNIARGLEASSQSFDIDLEGGDTLRDLSSAVKIFGSTLINTLTEGEAAAFSSAEIAEQIKTALKENEDVVKSIINNALLTGTTDLGKTINESLSKFFPEGLKFAGNIEKLITDGAVEIFGGASALVAAEIKAAASRRAKVEEDIVKKQKEILGELNKIKIPAQLSSQLQALSNAVGQTAQELENNIRTFQDFTSSIGKLDVPLGDIDLSTAAGAGFIQAGRAPEILGGEVPNLEGTSRDVLEVFDITLKLAQNLIKLQAAGSQLVDKDPLSDVKLPFDDISAAIDNELATLTNISDEQAGRIREALTGLANEIAAGGASIESTTLDIDEILTKALDGVELKKDSNFSDKAASILLKAVGPERAKLTAKFADIVAGGAANLFKTAQFAIQRQLATLQFRFADIQGPKEAFDALRQTLDEASKAGVGISKTFKGTGVAIDDLISSATNIDAITQANDRNNQQLEKVLSITRKLSAARDPEEIDELTKALLNAQSGLAATKGSVQAFSTGLEEASKVAGDALEKARERLEAQPGRFNERAVAVAERNLTRNNEKLAEGARILRQGQKDAFDTTLRLTQLQESAAQRSANALLQAAVALEAAAKLLPKLDPNKDIFKNIKTITTGDIVITQRISDTGQLQTIDTREATPEEKSEREKLALGGESLTDVINLIEKLLSGGDFRIEQDRGIIDTLLEAIATPRFARDPRAEGLQDVSRLTTNQLKELVQLTKEQILKDAGPQQAAAIAALGTTFDKNLEAILQGIKENRQETIRPLLEVSPQAQELQRAREDQEAINVEVKIDTEGIKETISASFGTVSIELSNAGKALGAEGSARALTDAAGSLSEIDITTFLQGTAPQQPVGDPTITANVETGFTDLDKSINEVDQSMQALLESVGLTAEELKKIKTPTALEEQQPTPGTPRAEEGIGTGPIEKESEKLVLAFNDAAEAAGGLPGPFGIVVNALAAAATAIPRPEDIEIPVADIRDDTTLELGAIESAIFKLTTELKKCCRDVLKEIRGVNRSIESVDRSIQNVDNSIKGLKLDVDVNIESPSVDIPEAVQFNIPDSRVELLGPATPDISIEELIDPVTSFLNELQLPEPIGGIPFSFEDPFLDLASDIQVLRQSIDQAGAEFAGLSLEDFQQQQQALATAFGITPDAARLETLTESPSQRTDVTRLQELEEQFLREATAIFGNAPQDVGGQDLFNRISAPIERLGPISDKLDSSTANLNRASQSLVSFTGGRQARTSDLRQPTIQAQVEDQGNIPDASVALANTANESDKLTTSVSQTGQEFDEFKFLLDETGTAFKDVVTKGRLLALSISRTGEIIETAGGFFETQQTEQAGFRGADSNFFATQEAQRQERVALDLGPQAIPDTLKNATDDVGGELKNLENSIIGLPPLFSLISQALAISSIGAIPGPTTTTPTAVVAATPDTQAFNSALGNLETSISSTATKVTEANNEIQQSSDSIRTSRADGGVPISAGEGGRQQQFTRGIFGDELFGSFTAGGFSGGDFGPSDITRPFEEAGGGVQLAEASNKIVSSADKNSQVSQVNTLSSEVIRLAADGFRLSSESFQTSVDGLNAIIDPQLEARPEQKVPEAGQAQDRDNVVQQIVSSNEQTVAAISELGGKLDTISTGIQDQTNLETSRAEGGEGVEIEGLTDVADAAKSNTDALNANAEELSDLAGELSDTAIALGEGINVQLESTQNLRLDIVGLEGAVERLKPEFEAVAKKAAQEVVSAALRQLAASAGSAEAESSINNAIPD